MKNSFTPRDAVPGPEERQFPMIIEHKGSKITVYQIANHGCASFTIVYYSEGQRQSFTRRNFETAFTQAQQVVLQLGDGHGDVLVLAGKDRRVYERALDLIRPLGLDLEQLAAEAVELRQRLNGAGSPLDAADYFAKTRPKVSPSMTVQAVVDEFIESRRTEQVGPLYLRDLRIRLKTFAEAFQCPITLATPLEIDRFLNKLNVSPRTRYNYRGTIGTLMNYAKERHYLPLDFTGLLRNGKKRKFVREVVVFTPEEMSTLLGAAKPKLTVPLAVSAFGGVRAEELKRLDWANLKLEKGHIEIPARISKTKLRRLVPITENLRAWLEPHRERGGPICVYRNLSNEYLKLAAKAEITWKRNGLRHSFVSYRVADIANVPQVACESGHTVKELQTDYLEVVDKDAARKWFSIMPTTPTNVVKMPPSETTPGEAAAVANDPEAKRADRT